MARFRAVAITTVNANDKTAVHNEEYVLVGIIKVYDPPGLVKVEPGEEHPTVRKAMREYEEARWGGEHADEVDGWFFFFFDPNELHRYNKISYSHPWEGDQSTNCAENHVLLGIAKAFEVDENVYADDKSDTGRRCPCCGKTKLEFLNHGSFWVTQEHNRSEEIEIDNRDFTEVVRCTTCGFSSDSSDLFNEEDKEDEGDAS